MGDHQLEDLAAPAALRRLKLAITALVLCASCEPTKYVETLKLNCPATTTSAWTLVGAAGAAQNISVEYWCDGGCTVQVKGKTPGGVFLPGPTREHSGVPPAFPMPGVNTADFICNGTGGTCEFRITKIVPPSGTVTKEER